jgi:zona occludens toxin (predicted ATPase)
MKFLVQRIWKYLQQNYRRKLSQPKDEMAIKVQEAYRTQNKWNQKRKPSCHIIIKTLNIQNKERILKAAREKGQVTYKGRPIRIILVFSTETMKARKALSGVMQTPREHKCQLRQLWQAQLSINIDGEIKIFQEKTKLKQYLSANPALQKILEEKLQQFGIKC